MLPGLVCFTRRYNNLILCLTVQTWVWIIAGVLVYVGVIIQLILFVITSISIHNLRKDYNKDEYFESHAFSYLIAFARSIGAFCSFIIWFRLLKYVPSSLCLFVFPALTCYSPLEKCLLFLSWSMVVLSLAAHCNARRRYRNQRIDKNTALSCTLVLHPQS